MDLIVNIILGIVVAATPLVFAAIGELVVEKAGVLNLGVEGMMIVGAIAGFATTIETGNYLAGIVAAIMAGALMAFLFGVLTQTLLANQVATGLALTMFGLGLAALWGQGYSGKTAGNFPKLDIPGLTDLPVVGKLIFGQDFLVYASIFLVLAVSWFFRKTRGGLIIRAIGENHDAAHAIGYPVVFYRYLALLFGGACAGLGGAYLSIVQTPFWAEDMTAGRGWIALALVVFAAWRPGRALLGAYLFGGITILQLHLQAASSKFEPTTTTLIYAVIAMELIAAFVYWRWRSILWARLIGVLPLAFLAFRAANIKIEAQYLSMLPYLATIVVLVIISSDRMKVKLNAPACLAQPFRAAT